MTAGPRHRRGLFVSGRRDPWRLRGQGGDLLARSARWTSRALPIRIGCRKGRTINPPPFCGGGWRAERAGRGGVLRVSTAPLPACCAGHPLPQRGEGKVWEGVGLCNVLTLFLTSAASSAISLCRSAPVEGRAREASQCGSRHGPAAGLAILWSREADPGLLQVRLKRTVREEAAWLFHPPTTASSRAATPRHPRANPDGSQLTLRARRRWLQTRRAIGDDKPGQNRQRKAPTPRI